MPLRRVLLAGGLMVSAACSDGGPGSGIEGAWQLTSVNAQPLPAPGNATAGETWIGAVLQISGSSGSFDRCLQSSPTSVPVTRSTAVLVAPLPGDRVAVSYFERRDAVPDTASLEGSQLTLRYRNILAGQVAGLDVLTFVPMVGALPPCVLSP